MRRVRCPVLVLTGDQEDTWRELEPTTSSALRVAWLRRAARGGGRHRPLRPHRGPRRDDAPHRGVRVVAAPRGSAVTAAFLLHDLGSEAAGEPWRAVVPDGWEAPDLPGHGATPAPRHGAYDPLGPTTLARWALGGAGPGGRRRPERPRRADPRRRRRLRRGRDRRRPVGPRGRAPTRRSTRCTARSAGCSTTTGATAPPPPTGLDPRTRHGYGVTVSPAFVQKFWGAITCPVLAIETPASPTPPDERAERRQLVRRRDARSSSSTRRIAGRGRWPSRRITAHRRR